MSPSRSLCLPYSPTCMVLYQDLRPWRRDLTEPPQPKDRRWWAKWAPSAQGTPSPSMSLNKWWRDWGPNGNLAAKTRPERYISKPGGPAVSQAKGCLGSGSCVNSLRSSFRKDGEDCCSCPLEELCK